MNEALRLRAEKAAATEEPLDEPRDEILDVAATVLEEEGPEALTMRELAASIRAPSALKHVRDKDDIVAGVQRR